MADSFSSTPPTVTTTSNTTIFSPSSPSKAHHFISIKVTSTNYLLWKTQANPFLRSQKLIGFFDGSIPAPLRLIAVEGQSQPQPNSAFQNWSCQDQYALSMLISSLSQNVIPFILVPIKNDSCRSILDLVFSDVWGLAPISSINGHEYFVIFIDAVSKYIWFYPMVRKSDVFDIFHNFQIMFEHQFSIKLKSVQTDWSGEHRKLNKHFSKSWYNSSVGLSPYS